jgi:hypothetical protein
MLPHQQRVVTERDELSIKVKALTDFVGSSRVYLNLPIAERGRLRRQLHAMVKYLWALNDRISAFT